MIVVNANCLFFAVAALYAFDPPNPIGYPAKGDPGGGIGAVRVWFADGAWHVRTSTEDSTGKRDTLMVFAGSVRCEDKLTVEPKKLEKGARKTADTVTPHADGKGFDFRFATYGGRDQVDFTAGKAAKMIKLKLLIDGKPAPPHRVLIGAEGAHPEKNEFTLPAKPAEPKKGR